ncbi:helix-turn-helix domain-containing protein [Streptomyces sp. NPDC001492]
MSRGGVDGFRGDRLRRARLRRALSLAELAVAAESNPNSISRLERGEQKPPPLLLGRLAETLGVKTEYLAPLPAKPTLRHIRERAGLTGSEIAHALDVTPGTVSSTERGVTHPRDAPAWARAYGLGLTEFLAAWEHGRTATARRVKGP